MPAVRESYAELELAVHRSRTEDYRVELRFSHPRSDAEIAPEQGPAPLALPELLALENDFEAYGRHLAEKLFHDSSVRLLYARVCSVVEATESFLRLRLRVGQSAPELQALRWELLRDPESGALLSTSERTLFSRFMVSRDWRPVGLRARSQLTALVAVAAPSNLAKFGLAEVDLEGEVARARESLQGIHVKIAGFESPLTPQALLEGLRSGVDVLYLACHGTLHRRSQQPILFLQDASGGVETSNGAEIAQRISELMQPPRLVVLASCESAGKEQGIDARGKPTVQASLAPRLAEAGVPAIVAMQGKISMETVEQAMPVFFRELVVDGQIDRAMAVARGAVRERSDSWMPALYLRLKGGRIWYEPGFSGEDDEFKKWKSITTSIRQGTFVPIVGPDLAEEMHGTRREIAEHLADAHDFPMAPHQRADLAKVCQYLSILESRKFARDEYLRELRAMILRRHPELDLERLDFKALFKAVIHHRYQDEANPIRILADLGGSIYVNASIDPMLPLALAEAGAKPKPLFCNWRKTRDNHPQEPAYEGTPSAESPIVYYPFGFLAQSDSIVVSEDDFVDYLIAAADYRLVPRVVRGSLVKSSLLFLGFSLEDWPFRLLFRLIMSLDGSAQLGDHTHVGVQIDPTEHDLSDVERARSYLQDYFGPGGEAPRIDIYWGSAPDFLRDLSVELEKVGNELIAPAIEEDDDDWF